MDSNDCQSIAKERSLQQASLMTHFAFIDSLIVVAALTEDLVSLLPKILQ